MRLIRMLRNIVCGAKHGVRLISCFGLCLLLINCSSRKVDIPHSPRAVPQGHPIPKGGGSYKVGKPYQIFGRWYHPREDPDYRVRGVASWYGQNFHGRYTANGEIYDMHALSAAHPTMPLPSYARVTNLENGHSIVVRVNDRGPYAHERVIDLSMRAAEMLDFHEDGTADVEVSYMSRAPISGEDGWLVNVPGISDFDQEMSIMANVEMDDVPVPEYRDIRVSALSSPSIPPVRSTGGHAREEERERAETGVYLQAGSFRDIGNAYQIGDRFQSIGQSVDVSEVDVLGATYYRVRVGPVSGEREAESVLHFARSVGAQEAFLMEVE